MGTEAQNTSVGLQHVREPEPQAPKLVSAAERSAASCQAASGEPCFKPEAGENASPVPSRWATSCPPCREGRRRHGPVCAVPGWAAPGSAQPRTPTRSLGASPRWLPLNWAVPVPAQSWRLRALCPSFRGSRGDCLGLDLTLEEWVCFFLDFKSKLQKG